MGRAEPIAGGSEKRVKEGRARNRKYAIKLCGMPKNT